MSALAGGDGRLDFGGEPVVPWPGQLAPSAEGRRIVPASSGAQRARALGAAGSDAVQWAVEVGREAVGLVSQEVPAHAEEGVAEVTRTGTEATTLQLLIALSGVPVEEAATPDALAGIPYFVRHRMSLDELLRGIQLGHSVIAAAFLAECGRLGDPELRPEQMRTLSQRMFMFFDDFSARMAAAHREEELRWSRSDAAARFTLARELLRDHDHAPAEASERLRYDLSQSHVAAIVWSSARTIEADQQGLHDTALGLLRQSGCDQRLVLSAGVGVVWAWASPKGDHRELVSRLVSMPMPSSTHVALGGVGRGIEGFRESHEEAEAVFRLRSALPDAPAEVTPYSEVDLLTLLLADRERALRFARAELGALGGQQPVTAELRRTLAAYLDERNSPHAAAQRLIVSRNTVSYRVRRAEELIGRPIGERRLQLQAALAIFAEYEQLR